MTKSISEGVIVRVIGGNNEIGQRTMIGQVGVVESIGSEYKVKGKNTREVYVRFINQLYQETHVFNDYHLIKI